MVFRRFASTDLADIAALLNRLGDDMDDTITKVLGARKAAETDPTGVLARYADTAQKAWDGLAALTTRVTNTEGRLSTLGDDTGWTTTGITARSGWAIPAVGVASWGPMRIRRVGGLLHLNGVITKSSGTYASGDPVATLAVGYRPSAYWQGARGAVDASGVVYCQEAGSGPVALNFTIPVG